MSPFRGALVAGFFVVWFFIFVGGRYEWLYDVPRGCDSTMCADGECYGYSSHSSHSSHGGSSTSTFTGCKKCKPGYINGGMQCFASLTDLPPVQTAAGLGGDTYFSLIVAAQIAGASTELVLIQRLRKMDMMPPSELFGTH